MSASPAFISGWKLAVMANPPGFCLYATNRAGFEDGAADLITFGDRRLVWG